MTRAICRHGWLRRRALPRLWIQPAVKEFRSGTPISASGQNNPAGSVSPGPPAGSIGFNVGNGTSLTNCRATLYDIAYAVSGGGVSYFQLLG